MTITTAYTKNLTVPAYGEVRLFKYELGRPRA